MKKQSVNARITREANETIEMWKKVYGGRNKSEAIRNVNLLLFAAMQEHDPNCPNINHLEN